jgi:hypothetical protein
MGEIGNNDDAPANSILLGGEDDMEVDENVPSLPPVETAGSDDLISRIITPSPYPHHVTGATAARFRNAMGRVTTHPTSDVEAWQALITEASACYRNVIPSLHSVDADTHAKLDWIESCYGTLLKYFPYASAYYVTIVEMLLAQSARVGEEEGPLIDYGMDPSQRAVRCEAKVQVIFCKVLGVDMDGTPNGDKVGGICSSSVELWLLFVRKRVRDANRHAATLSSMDERDNFLRQATISAYELAVSHASFVFNNHLLWKQYLNYVKSWVPNPALNSDHGLSQNQMVQLRSVYQRLVTHPMTGLDQLWQEYEAFERGQSEHLATALIAEYAPKYQHARSVYLERNRVYNVADLQVTRLATPPVDVSDEDYRASMIEEQSLLTLWKKRTSYERTNPERLAATDLVQRVRQAYKEMACVFTLHPETWHMWGMWELLRVGAKDSDKVENAVAVLKLAQEHISDCTLLAYAEAQVVELYSDKPADCMRVMERFLEQSPNTLGFVLYQQMVRRYKGIQPARAVFSKARRILLESSATENSAAKQDTSEKPEVKTELAEGESGAVAANDAVEKTESGVKRTVTNRLDPLIRLPDMSTVNGENPAAEATVGDQQDKAGAKVSPGAVTWQLYASHATMEHRLNHLPAVAARVYELGLRKHLSFLTKPSYISRYAQLLLELRDTENLRALLTRAVAACEAEDGMEDAVAAFWDMTLRFEAILSGTDAGNMSSLQTVERKRHAALMGAEVEDVSTGGIVDAGDTALGIGSHKSTIAEQLIRSEGYDISSNIINGMSRTVDLLDVTGLWRSGEGAAAHKRSAKPSMNELEDSLAGGKSDACYQRRLDFQNSIATGVSASSGIPSDAAGSKLLSVRERFQQAGPSVQQSAASLAVQQSPEWLQPMLMLLPASNYRSAAMNKPPPHMIEMALSALRSNALPAERPSAEVSSNNRKRKLDGGDSSDEENGGAGGGGYGSQFRVRQRARQMNASGVEAAASN